MNNVNINVQCECYHRRGLFYYAWPLAWGRPCRRCRRMMTRGIVVVPQMSPVQTTTTVMPAQCATTWQIQQQQQPMPMPMQAQMQMQMQMQEPQMMSALPPKYDQAVAAN